MKKDIPAKRLEDYPDVFADIFNAHMGPGHTVFREEDLLSVPTEAFRLAEDGNLRQGNRDVVKRDIRNGTVLAIAGIENQAGCDNTMPVRVMGYDFSSYVQQIHELIQRNRKEGRPAIPQGIHRDQRLAPVVTLVLYFGQEAWIGPRRLTDLLEVPEDVRPGLSSLIKDYEINLVEVAHLTTKERARYQSDFRIVADFVCSQNDRKLREQLIHDQKQKISHPAELLDMLGTIGRDHRYQSIKDEIVKLSEKEDITMCQIAEELEQKGAERMRRLMAILLEKKLYQELEKAAEDAVYCESLMKKYKI